MDNEDINILIVDNNPLSEAVFKKILKTEKYSVTFCNIDKIALQHIEKMQIDILITDRIIEGIDGSYEDGFDLIHEAKKINNNLYTIISSSYLEDASFKTAIKLGINEYITKNITQEELRNSIKRAAYFVREKKMNMGIKIPLHKELRRSMMQYLNFFPEFIEITKGINIDFAVISEENGLNIKSSNFEDVTNYLEEFMGFLKGNINNLNPTFENRNLTGFQKEGFMLSLQNEVFHLKQALNIKNLENKFLETSLNDMRHYLELSIKKENVFKIENRAEAFNENNINVLVNVKYEIIKMIEEFEDIIKTLPEDDSENRKHCEEIKKELCSIDFSNTKNIESKKDVFGKIKTFIDTALSSGQIINKYYDKAKDLYSALRKVGKTYNVIALFFKWDTLPQDFVGE